MDMYIGKTTINIETDKKDIVQKQMQQDIQKIQNKELDK